LLPEVLRRTLTGLQGRAAFAEPVEVRRGFGAWAGTTLGVLTKGW